jgi:hypothetical protein
MSTISDSGTAAPERSFTIMNGEIVSLTITSSDQSLITDDNIGIVDGIGNTIQLETTEGIAQSVSFY